MPLRIDDISTRIGWSPIHRAVSITVGAGEIIAILGSNGAGKTSLLRATMGLLPLTAGRILLDDRDITGLPPHRRNQAGLGYVPEGRRVFATMSVRENLEVGAYGCAPGRSRLAALVETAYARFPVLREKAGDPGFTLSGGQQQMLAIGRALMSEPQTLLLDEPSLGLAPQLVRVVRDAILDIRRSRGISILLVEQNAGLALSVADRVYLMTRGSIVAEGTPAELGSSETLRALYLGQAADANGMPRHDH